MDLIDDNLIDDNLIDKNLNESQRKRQKVKPKVNHI